MSRQRALSTINEPTLTPEELARRIGCSVKTLVNWRWKKIGPKYVRLFKRGNPVVYLISEVEAWERKSAGRKS